MILCVPNCLLHNFNNEQKHNTQGHKHLKCTILCWMASLLLNCLVVGSSITVEGTLVDPSMCPLNQAGLTSGTVPSNRPLGLASKTL